MFRSKALFVVPIFIAVVIVLAWLANPATATPTTAANVKPIPPSSLTHPPFQLSESYVAGSPAIRPTLPQGAQSASQPGFTQDDVAAFLMKYGFPAPVAPGAQLKILTIQFVTAKQASQLMAGASVDRPGNYLVCYVKVQGPFLLTGLHVPPSRPNASPRPTTALTGDAVFDAHTGNLLVWGVYPK